MGIETMMTPSEAYLKPYMRHNMIEIFWKTAVKYFLQKCQP